MDHSLARSVSRQFALELYAAAVAGADPATATSTALARTSPSRERIWVVAIGKAALPMARAALDALDRAGHGIAGGLVVSVQPARPLRDGIAVLQGDHPLAGDRSEAAAAQLDDVVAQVRADDELLVLLSGGTSALIGAPVPGVTAEDFRALHAALLGAGADIAITNAIRKRFARWGAGRLALAAAPARVRCLAVSDVARDDLATIGSGPCTADPLTAHELDALLERERLSGVLPPRLREWIARAVAGDVPETPKPGDAAFANVSSEVVLSNRDALTAAARLAVKRGARCEIARDELSGDAADAGRAVASLLLARAAELMPHAPGTEARLVLLFGGETTVRLDDMAGTGGRCQELALAAAELLHAADVTGRSEARRVVLLAAGTDGRDGPTDAAGALVDARSWSRAAHGGVDPVSALTRHDSYAALDAAGDLLRGGLTGTNVRDVVIGVVTARDATERER